MINLKDVWTAHGGPTGPLGSPVKPPGWATAIPPAITPADTADQQATTGGHNGQVAFFQKGLLYWRDGLMAPDNSPAPLVMTYEPPEMGFDYSARFRLQLLDQFTDKNGLVLVNYTLADYRSEHGLNAPPDLHFDVPIADNLPNTNDTNDSAWMTGQALAAVSMVGDMTSAALILRGMRDFEWSPVGDLLRYTGNSNPFHGADPFTQIAGCYFAGKFAEAAGNTIVRGLARDVIGKWIDEIFRSNGALGPNGPKILLPNLIVLKQVAQKVGVDQTRLDHLTLLIDEQKIIAAAVTFGALSTFALLDDATLYGLCAAVEAGLNAAPLGLPKWLRLKLQLGSETTPLDTSGLNLMFWNVLVMLDCSPTALLNGVAKGLANVTSGIKMMPYQWLGGGPAGVSSSQAYVKDWQGANGDTATKKPSRGNYLWRTDKREDPGGDTFNRVDYLVLRGLLNLDQNTWQHAPDHFGIAFDLPIPQLGSVHFAGSVNSDGTFSISGSETLAPFGFKLSSAKFQFRNDGIDIDASLQVRDWNIAHVTGSVDLHGGFSIGVNLSLGALGGPLAAILTGNVGLTLDPNGLALDGNVGIPGVGGSFHFHAAVHSDGQIDVTGIPGSFTLFPIRELARLWHGIGATVDHVAGGLLHAGHTLAEAADALLHGAGFDLNSAAAAFRGLGQAAGAVADALKPLAGGSAAHAVVRGALEAAHYAAAEVSQAMRHAYSEIPHQDVEAIPAINTWLIPHIDTPPGPHIDTWLIPHVDTVGPHSDTPHNDGHPFHTDAHTDHGHGITHVDIGTNAPGPHVDTPHVNTHVPPHVDTPHQNHKDGPVPAHGDTPHQNHQDHGPQGHIDIP